MRALILILSILYSTMSVAGEPAAASTSPTTQAIADGIGLVISTKGQVGATLPDQEKRPLARRSSVYKEDILESQKRSSAQINFTDGTLLLIKENTTLSLEKYNYNKTEPDKDSYVMSITKGGFRTVTGEIGKKNPSSYEVKTPIATLSVAGTDYSVIVKDNNDTLIAVAQGKIAALNLKGQKIILGSSDQKYAMISAKNQEIKVLKSLPSDFKDLSAVKLGTKGTNNNTTTKGGGGFCVGS